MGLLVNPQGQAPTQQGGDAIAAPDVYNPRRLAAELWVGIRKSNSELQTGAWVGDTEALIKTDSLYSTANLQNIPLPF